jgi:hypothetical protein
MHNVVAATGHVDPTCYRTICPDSGCGGSAATGCLGAFRPEDPAELASMVDGFLSQARQLPQEPLVLIAPHIGYVYSGAVAGTAFRQLRGSHRQHGHVSPHKLRGCGSSLDGTRRGQPVLHPVWRGANPSGNDRGPQGWGRPVQPFCRTPIPATCRTATRTRWWAMARSCSGEARHRCSTRTGNSGCCNWHARHLSSDSEPARSLRRHRTTPPYCSPGGAFVTLKQEGRLRGCVGNLLGNLELYRTVQKMALAAATQDHRFGPVSVQELPE